MSPSSSILQVMAPRKKSTSIRPTIQVSLSSLPKILKPSSRLLCDFGIALGMYSKHDVAKKSFVESVIIFHLDFLSDLNELVR
ncbi:uncharacterized protein LOC127265050 isoform X2 [Andrographis paniculata]|uniref:uncharacterized protein LOC127265050 isoform X2 n=1 Tax=Andrographis paniculata TaxID=175694 RepID=UPI0021E8DBB4|nr:uncharacterized protein LOC127265050 isoform X2 [Andrographis paniculata]